MVISQDAPTLHPAVISFIPTDTPPILKKYILSHSPPRAIRGCKHGYGLGGGGGGGANDPRTEGARYKNGIQHSKEVDANPAGDCMVRKCAHVVSLDLERDPRGWTCALHREAGGCIHVSRRRTS